MTAPISHEELAGFIKETGFRTFQEIQAQFPNQSEEILHGVLTYLKGKGIERVLYSKGRHDPTNGKLELFYNRYSESF